MIPTVIVVAFLCAAAGADVYSTLLALRFGAHEANPFASFLMSLGGRPAFAILRVLMTCGSVWALANGLLFGIAFWVAVAMTILSLWVVYSNWYTTFKALGK